MSDLYERIQNSVEFIRSKTDHQPTIGIITGSGLSGIRESMEIVCEIPYADIPDFPEASVKGHDGNLIFGTYEGVPVLVMNGRFHYYEGISMREVSFPIRVMKFLGIETLMITNAAGGLRPGMEVGDVMLIKDHIYLQPDNPLRGPNDERLGPRFPDMFNAYDEELRSLAHEVAHEKKIRISEGVYVSVAGPTFETPSEYRYYHLIGGDAIGMSTASEVIVARHMDLKVFAISVIADIGYPPESIQDISHEIVLEQTATALPKVDLLLSGLVKAISVGVK